MNYIILRLEGPIQSWGEKSFWDERDTSSMPTKSAVIGMIAGCMGLSRDSDRIPEIYDNSSLSVRVDDPGQILRDYQTIENTQKADGKINPNMVVSPRYYLVDASFLVALGVKSQSLLQEIETALINPHWPPYLGRKCCIPSFPVYVDAIEKDNPIDALWNKNYPIRSYTKPSQTIELNVEGLESTSRPYRKRDVYGKTRFFKYRFVHEVLKESQDFPKQNIIEEFKNESLTH